MHVDGRMTLRGLDPQARAALKARTTYPNPEYRDAKRAGRWTGNIPEYLTLWRETPEGLELPRGMMDAALRESGDDLYFGLTDGRVCPKRAETVELRAELRDYQEEAVEAALAEEQGVIVAPTGSGKTVIGMALVARSETPALILVHTGVLLEQTAREVREKLGVEPGIIGGGKNIVRDVTVAMVQTLARRDLRELAGRFGLVLLDEVHHCPASTFRDLVQQFPAHYRFGLTATPKRKDGLMPMLLDVVGPIVYEVHPSVLLDKGAILPAEVLRVQTGFCPETVPLQAMSAAQVARLERDGLEAEPSVDYVRLVNLLCEDAERNDLICRTVRNTHRGRSLVLTERVEHAHALAAALGTPYLTGEDSRTRRAEVLQRFRDGTTAVLVATSALVGEGFDLPAIDTIYLAAPNGNTTRTTQILGRCLRPGAGKVTGRIVDFMDAKVEILRWHAARRARVYRTFVQ